MPYTNEVELYLLQTGGNPLPLRSESGRATALSCQATGFSGGTVSLRQPVFLIAPGSCFLSDRAPPPP